MALLHAHAHQWVNIVKNASETLCSSLRENRAAYFRSEAIEKALSDAIFHQMSFTANYTDDQDDWGLEISKSRSRFKLDHLYVTLITISYSAVDSAQCQGGLHSAL